MKDKLFDIVDDVPKLNALMLNIPVFKSLYLKDKTPLKEEYAKWLQYFYFICHFKSPFYETQDKERFCFREVFGNKSYEKSITKEIQQCIDVYLKTEDTTERRALEAGMQAGDNIANNLRLLGNDTDLYKTLIDELNGYISDTTINFKDRLGYLKTKGELEKTLVEQSKEIAVAIEKLEKYVSSLVTLKEKALSAHDNLEVKLEDSLIEEFIDEYMDTYEK